MIDARFRLKMQSPCCRAVLVDRDDDLHCSVCAAIYPIRSFGADLVPADLAAQFPSFRAWEDVQEALTRWRQRTWNGSADAAQRTDGTRQLADEFFNQVQPFGEVLDVGCGSGWLGELLASRGVEYCGVDPRPSAERYAVPFARAVADRLPFGDAMFDGCLFFSSLDYSLSIDAALAEAVRVLRPGGLLAVATPIHRDRELRGEALHMHRWVDGDLEPLIAAAIGEPLVWAPRNNHRCFWIRKAAR